jgi:hypothetical protein
VSADNTGDLLYFFAEQEKGLPAVYFYFDANQNKFMPSKTGENSQTLYWGNGKSTYSVEQDGKVYLRYYGEDEGGDTFHIETWFSLDARTKTFSDGGNRCELFYYDYSSWSGVKRVEHEVCLKVDHIQSSTGGSFRMVYYPTKYGNGGDITYTW